MSVSEPVIGLCAAWERTRWAFWDQPAAVVSGTYLDAVRRDGGVPVALAPAQSDAAEARTLVERVDGLMLLGGSDVDPAAYGARPSPRTESTAPIRDRYELALVRAALARDLPILGICRGLQILNVGAGGTLHQHLLDEGFGEHRPVAGALDHTTHHEIVVAPGTLAAQAAGGLRRTVNSHHHQGVARVGDGGVVTARSVPDGVIEAVEWPDRRYVLGVQWHPEALELDATIAGFVAAAAERALSGV